MGSTRALRFISARMRISSTIFGAAAAPVDGGSTAGFRSRRRAAGSTKPGPRDARRVDAFAVRMTEAIFSVAVHGASNARPSEASPSGQSNRMARCPGVSGSSPPKLSCVARQLSSSSDRSKP